jgi:hypothetical protein
MGWAGRTKGFRTHALCQRVEPACTSTHAHRGCCFRCGLRAGARPRLKREEQASRCPRAGSGLSAAATQFEWLAGIIEYTMHACRAHSLAAVRATRSAYASSVGSTCAAASGSAAIAATCAVRSRTRRRCRPGRGTAHSATRAPLLSLTSHGCADHPHQHSASGRRLTIGNGN